MPIPTSDISFSSIRDELGLSPSLTNISIDRADFRQIAKGSPPTFEHTPVFGSQISMSEFSGKSLGNTVEFTTPGTFSFTIPLHKSIRFEVFGAGGGGSGGGVFVTQSTGESVQSFYSPGAAGTAGTITSISLPTGAVSAGAGSGATGSPIAVGAAGIGSGGNTSNTTGGGSPGGAGGPSTQNAAYNGATGGAGGFARSDFSVGTLSVGVSISYTIGSGGTGGAGNVAGSNGSSGRIRITWT